MKRKIRQIFCALTVVSLITGSIPVSAFATVDEGGQIGSDDMMISPDYDAAEITVLGEDGKPLSTDDEAYKNALEKYNGFFSQLDGKTFDASNNDMTDLIIDQMNEMEGMDTKRHPESRWSDLIPAGSWINPPESLIATIFAPIC